MIVNVYIPILEWDDRDTNYINFKLFNPENSMIYKGELALSPEEAIIIGTKLVEAAIKMLSKEELETIRNDTKRG